MTVLTTVAFAQELSRDEVLANLEQTSNNLQDASFLVTGRLIDADTQEFNLEIQVQMIPAENLVRMDFFQPDAVADNVMMVDKDGVYSYNFLTNQITIYSLGDSAAMGGLLPASDSGGSYYFTLNMTELFSGYDVSLEGYEQGLYNLRFTNKVSEGVTLAYIDVFVDETLWLPTQMLFYNPEDSLLAELNIGDYQVDTGLNPDDVRYLDDTAEIIDER